MTRLKTSFVRQALLSLVGAALGLCLLSSLFIAYQFFFRDRAIFGVRAAGQSLLGMTRADAQHFLETQFGASDAIRARANDDQIDLRDGAWKWQVSPWELGLRADFTPVAEEAVSIGHRGSIGQMVVEQARCLVLACDISLDAQFDDGTARVYLDSLALQVERPTRDAAVQILGLRVVATPAQNGRAVDRDAMLGVMRDTVLGHRHGEIDIAVVETKPLILDVQAARAQAEAILSAPVMLTFNDRIWAIDQGALAGMLTLTPKRDADGISRLNAALDHAQLVAYLNTIARDINQPARDARFHFDDKTNVLTPTIPSQNGQTLDPEAAAKQIEAQLGRGTSSARTIVLSVSVAKPTIAMEDASKFGIKELAAQGVSVYRGSSAGRAQNIRTTTAAMDGIVVPPGATFSFDKYLPEVVEANGFDDAYIIFNDQTVLGPGGGVCQVSTTLFRAAFFGGYPIVDRSAHAYRVSTYEPPLGLDATVFAPIVDMKFRNDTENYLLIQPKLDLRAGTLTFNFYGTKPNRTVEMEDPIIENVVPHGAAVYVDDPTIRKGVTKQVDLQHDGMDVTVYRKISVNGKMVKREKFFSHYQPWVARYLVGTKIPK